MGGIVKRPKGAGRALQDEVYPTVSLACGHQTVEPPTLSSPSKWWCCGAWQKGKP